MDEIRIDKLRIRLKNVSSERVHEALPGAWRHLKIMMAHRSPFAESRGNDRFVFSQESLDAGKVESGSMSSHALSVEIAENIYRSLGPTENQSPAAEAEPW